MSKYVSSNSKSDKKYTIFFILALLLILTVGAVMVNVSLQKYQELARIEQVRTTKDNNVIFEEN